MRTAFCLLALPFALAFACGTEDSAPAGAPSSSSSASQDVQTCLDELTPPSAEDAQGRFCGQACDASTGRAWVNCGDENARCVCCDETHCAWGKRLP